jgi:hypothetical protein
MAEMSSGIENDTATIGGCNVGISGFLSANTL